MSTWAMARVQLGIVPPSLRSRPFCPGGAMPYDDAMIGIRLTKGEVWIREEEWPEWVRSRRVSAETWVHVGNPGEGRWTRAGDLEIFRRLRPDLDASGERLYPEDILGEAAAFEPEPRAEPAFEPPGLGSVVLPRKGFSATELLVIVNLIVAAVMVALWKQDYGPELWKMASGWYERVVAGHYYYFVPTMFMHAGPRHLLLNMASLLATCAGVEYLFGARRAVLGYLLTGLGGALLSFWHKSGPPLSVGASGAIFGFAGMLLVFLVRFYRRFSDRQKWKTRRIYIPLLVLFIVPSILQADGWAHLGGFATGLLVGLIVPAATRILRAFPERQVTRAEPSIEKRWE
jgi:rhomboid protease GluP